MPTATALGSRGAAGQAPVLRQTAASQNEINSLVAGILSGSIPLTGDQVNGAWTTLSAAAVAGSSQAAKLRGVIAQLDSVLQFQRGLAAYTEGVASAADGGQKLYDAVTGELASGTHDLRKAVTGELGDGVQELLDGVRELVDGVAEYDEEGISKITGRAELDQLNALLDTADALRQASEGYRSYSGAPEGVSSTVKFVMRTRQPEAPEEPEPEQPAAEAAGPERVSFWQRLKDLFFGQKD